VRSLLFSSLFQWGDQELDGEESTSLLCLILVWLLLMHWLLYIKSLLDGHDMRSYLRNDGKGCTGYTDSEFNDHLVPKTSHCSLNLVPFLTFQKSVCISHVDREKDLYNTL